eukprot:UN23349
MPNDALIDDADWYSDDFWIARCSTYDTRMDCEGNDPIPSMPEMFCEWICSNEESVDFTECNTTYSIPETATPRITSNTLTFDSECIFPFIVIEGTDIMSDSCTNYLEEDPSNYWCGTGEGTWGYCNTTKLLRESQLVVSRIRAY